MFDAWYRYSVELAGNRFASDNLYRVRKRARNECGERSETMLAARVDEATRRRVGSVHFHAMQWAIVRYGRELSARVLVDRGAPLRQDAGRRRAHDESKISDA
jgi:hypothetical protein